MVQKTSMDLIGRISLSWIDYLASPEYQELCEHMEKAKIKFEKEAEDAWESLDYNHQLRIFYAVVKRIYEAEIKEKGSYRYVLYDKFGFGPEAYALGMDCGYMYLHNAIIDGEDKLATE